MFKLKNFLIICSLVLVTENTVIAMENTQNKSHLSLGNVLYGKYVSDTNKLYWAQQELFAKKLENLMRYAKQKATERGDLTTLTIMMDTLYKRDHDSLPDLTAYTDTLWLVSIGVQGKYGSFGVKTGEAGRLFEGAIYYGAEYGLNLDKKVTMDDYLDIMMLSMIFSRLTEYSQVSDHPLRDYLYHNTVNNINAKDEKVKIHRAIAYAFSMMAYHICYGRFENAEVPKEFEEIIVEGSNAGNPYVVKEYKMFPKRGLISNDNEKGPGIEWSRKDIEKDYISKIDTVVEDVAGEFEKFNLQLGKEVPKKMKEYLSNSLIMNKFIDLYIPAANYVNDMKYLITRDKPEEMLKEEQKREAQQLQEEMQSADVKILDENIQVGQNAIEQVQNDKTIYELYTGGMQIGFEARPIAQYTRDIMLKAREQGANKVPICAVVKYYRLNPEKPVAEQINRRHEKYSLLQVPTANDIKPTEEKLGNSQLILVSFGDPEKNGIFVFAPKGQYDNNKSTMFKMIVKPSGSNEIQSIIKNSYAFKNPEKTRLIVKSLAEYLESLKTEQGGVITGGGKSLPQEPWKTDENFTNYFKTSKIVTRESLQNFSQLFYAKVSAKNIETNGRPIAYNTFQYGLIGEHNGSYYRTYYSFKDAENNDDPRNFLVFVPKQIYKANNEDKIEGAFYYTILGSIFYIYDEDDPKAIWCNPGTKMNQQTPKLLEEFLEIVKNPKDRVAQLKKATEMQNKGNAVYMGPLIEWLKKQQPKQNK